MPVEITACYAVTPGKILTGIFARHTVWVKNETLQVVTWASAAPSRLDAAECSGMP
jgi:hypothetical protein